VSPFASQRRAFSLVELLVASTIALVVMGGVATLLGLFSRAASSAQAIVDLTSRMRQTATLLEQDLDGLTVQPPAGQSVSAADGLSPYSVAGYFELIEGPETDAGKPWRGDITYPASTRVVFGGESWTALQNTLNQQPDVSPAVWQRTRSITSDIDDALLFTTRKSGRPFVGRQGEVNRFAESQTAEVAWFCEPAQVQPVQGQTLYTLHRRQLLVLPYVAADAFLQGEVLRVSGVWQASGAPNSISIETNASTAWTANTWTNLFSGITAGAIGGGSVTRCFDISLRRFPEDANRNGVLDPGEDLNGNGICEDVLLPNSLEDLSRRSNRFWRQSSVNVSGFPAFATRFPHRFAQEIASAGFNPSFNGTAREGEDILLANVLSFDVRVFDPGAPVHSRGGIAVNPGDPGYPVSPVAVVSGTANLPSTANANDMYQVSDTGDFWVCLASGAWERLPFGAYADLGWGVPVIAGFSGPQLALPARVPFDLNPAALTPGYDNRFPGSEDNNKNGSLDGVEDTNGNGRIDSFSAFQGAGVGIVNISPTNVIAQLYPVGSWQTASNTTWPPPRLVYDTWSQHYEGNGANEDGDAAVDEGSDGLDGDRGVTNGLSDELSERETSPPYPVSLRGIEVRIRCYEPTSKQIRQITIRQSFAR
jgi:type II secretory pathway pseudopilin PulG